jgi:hypothetical protein
MRWLAIFTCLAMGGCTSAVYDLPPTHAPELYAAIEGAKAGANEARLLGPVEVSAVREAHPLAPGSHILCIKGINSLDPNPRTYAVFFKDNKYVTARSSLIMDDCDAQAFSALGNGPFALAVKPPQPS